LFEDAQEVLMNRTLVSGALLAGMALLAPRPALADVSVWFGLPGVSVYAGPPVVPAPPVVVGAPYWGAPPVYYGPPVVVAPPCYRRPYYGYGGYGYGAYAPVYRGSKWKPGKRHGWYKHGRW
jgi:hypothetical protein